MKRYGGGAVSYLLAEQLRRVAAGDKPLGSWPLSARALAAPSRTPDPRLRFVIIGQRELGKSLRRSRGISGEKGLQVLAGDDAPAADLEIGEPSGPHLVVEQVPR